MVAAIIDRRISRRVCVFARLLVSLSLELPLLEMLDDGDELLLGGLLQLLLVGRQLQMLGAQVLRAHQAADARLLRVVGEESNGLDAQVAHLMDANEVLSAEAWGTQQRQGRREERRQEKGGQRQQADTQQRT